ncbi:unnamed protein product [Mytilus coruscus]|uniref:Reverse transcriptase domain-containing protein n=1 Tax=Mytilus coruscus TaxID=42192 RepID=A0A6J8CK86_MYTCO|nr:unnamed protein product [Mytilus coruscus]
MGPVQPPQRKGRMPQYSKNNLVELQNKFDELECKGVFRKPEDVGISVEYINPSFLVKRASGGFRLVTAFADVGRYSKPQPSLMPDVDSTLRTIAQWKYIIKSDLTSAFYQIPLAKDSMKYCGVATPYRGVRVYTRCAMGMPGSETALEELMCRIVGDFLQKGCVAKLADDLFCGGNIPEELLHTLGMLSSSLQKSGICLSPSKTVICPKSITILAFKRSQCCRSIDPAPGFRPLCDDSYLKQLNISIEIGRVNNQNKNPVADKAIAELEDELLREERDQSPLSENTLVIATTRLNSRLRQRGLSSRELWTQRNQFTRELLPISDMNLIRAQHEARNKNHGFREILKCSRPARPIPDVFIGDLVYLYTDRSKTQSRDWYLVVAGDGEWCFIKRFSGNQLRASSYKESDCDDHDEDSFPGPIPDLPPARAEPPPILICENIDDVENLDEPTVLPDNSLERDITDCKSSNEQDNKRVLHKRSELKTPARCVKYVDVCPDKQAWGTNAKDMCPNPDEYHCMFDTECNLVEDCRPKQTNNEIKLYFIEKNIANFYLRTVPAMSSNNPDYHILQQATFCKSASNISKSTSCDYNNNTSVSNNTIEQNSGSTVEGLKACCISFVILFVTSVALASIIPCIIYKIKRFKKSDERNEETNSLIKINNELDRVKKENCDVKQQLSQLKEDKHNIEEQLHVLQLKYMNGEQNNTQSRFAQESSSVGQTVPVSFQETDILL